MGEGTGGLVFGTLLGPEATGPCCLVSAGFPAGERGRGSGGVGLVFLVSWLRRAHTYVCGVCGTGLLFENYIVDASIFYKKQFPRYMNLDLCCCCWLCLLGCGRWWWCGFRGSLERIAFY